MFVMSVLYRSARNFVQPIFMEFATEEVVLGC